MQTSPVQPAVDRGTSIACLELSAGRSAPAGRRGRYALSDQLRTPGLAWADAAIAVGLDPAGVGDVRADVGVADALTGPPDGPDVGVLWGSFEASAGIRWLS
jgi:hypothetical protein